MTTPAFRSSRPDKWIEPRWKDPASARHRHGPLQPMQPARRSLLDWVRGR